MSPSPDRSPAPLVIAHRGISEKLPENTCAAFRRASESAGVDMAELDVRLSADEEVVVFHDRTLQRTTTGNGPVRSYRLEEIREFDAGSWFHPSWSSERVPTLRQVLEEFGGRLRFNIEIKSDWLHREPPGLLERKILDIVRQTGMTERVVISSFDHPLIRNIRTFESSIQTGVLYNLYRDFARSPLTLLAGAHADVFVCARHELRRSWVDAIHNAGKAIFVYTVSAAAEAERLERLGVDGIMSNAADDLARTLGRGTRASD